MGAPILFHVLHANFKEVPSSVSMNLLEDIVDAAKGLGLLESLAMWSQHWYEGAKAEALTVPENTTPQSPSTSLGAIIKKKVRLIWLAHDLGFSTEMRAAIQMTIFDLPVGKSAHLTYPGNAGEFPNPNFGKVEYQKYIGTYYHIENFMSFKSN